MLTRPRLLVAALVSAFALFGCAQTKVKESPEQAIAKRASERWALLVAGDFMGAYDWLSPGARQLLTREAYAAGMGVRPVKWVGAKVGEVKCEVDQSFCEVNVDVEIEVKSQLPGVGKLRTHSPLFERWVNLRGVWYYVPKDVSQH